MECPKFGEIFCRSLKNKNGESSAEDRGLACEVAEGSKDCTRQFVWNSWFWLAGDKELAATNKKEGTRTTKEKPLFY